MLTGPTVRRRRLGADLRRLREACGLRIDEVAARLEVAASTLSRIETGKAPTRTSYLRMMLDMYGVRDETERAELIELAREGQRRGWWTPWGDLLPAGFDGYLGLEAEAETLRVFSARFVPALLQTREYANAVVAASRPELAPSQLQDLVGVQIRRQDVLAGPAPARLEVVLDESVLRRSAWPAEAWLGQLAHLRAVAERSEVSLRVLPFAASQVPLPVGGFTIMTFAVLGDPPVLCTDGPRGQALIEQRGTEVAALAAVFERLSSVALAPAESAELISRIQAG